MTHTTRFLLLAALVSAPAVGAIAPAPASAQQLTPEMLAPLDYRSIGPTRESGRFVDIAVPEGRPFTFYMATGSGHLWKTVNNGITFEPLFTDEAVFSIGDVAIAPSDPDRMYLGSGEANNSRSTYWGDGVYRSDDAGETWRNVGLPESHHIGRVLVHPEDPDVVWVAALGHLYSENEERGLYRTRDGGATWERVLDHEVEGRQIGVVDIAMSSQDPDVLYATTFDKVRLPFTYDLGGPGSRVWKSTDGGDSWTMLENGLPGGMLGRIGVDVFDGDDDIVYLTVENANKEGMSDEERRRELLEHRSSAGMIGGEIYRSDDAGASWLKVSPDSQSIGGRPAYYYGQILVDPIDPDVVYVLSVSTWLSRDGGRTWDDAWDFGGDDHALWIDPENTDRMVLGYDHGMGVTFDGGEEWYHPDFQSLAQFYAVGIDMSYPYRVAGGLQDNGSHMTWHTNPAGGPIYYEAWEQVGGGDGMYNEFDWCEGRYLYNESQFGPIVRYDLWTGERESIRYQDDEMRWNWNAPIQVSPHDCDKILHAGNRLVVSENRGESWEVISPDLTKADPATLTTGKGGDGNIQYATITSIDESPLVEGLIWVGTDDGNLQVTRDGGESWTLLNDRVPDNPEYWVSRVEASHHRPGTAYVSYTGYRRDDFRPFVYRTDDYGQTWRDISSNLPATGPVNVVREHHENPDLLFVGTEFGVFVSIDGGAHWTAMKNDMPTNPVHDMKIHPRENDLVVATHGRGIYIADVAPLAELTPAVLAGDAHFFQPESKVRWIADDRTSYGSSNYRGESEPEAIPFYYWLGAPAGEVVLTVHLGEVEVARLEGPTGTGLHEVHWEMDRRTERSAEEQEEIRERYARFGREADEDEVRWESAEAPLGDYTVVMTVDGREVGSREVSILKDEWWMERR